MRAQAQMFHRAAEPSEHMQPPAIIISSRVKLQRASIKRTLLRERGFHKLLIRALMLQETRSLTKLCNCCSVTIQSYALHFFYASPNRNRRGSAATARTFSLSGEVYGASGAYILKMSARQQATSRRTSLSGCLRKKSEARCRARFR